MESKLKSQKDFSKYDIPVRHPKFDYSTYLNYKNRDQFLKSILPISLSICFPAGESWFINSLKMFEKDISDPKLLESIKQFCGQETAHTAVHKIYNEMLKKRDIINEKGYCTLDIVDQKISRLKERQKKLKNQLLAKRRMLAFTVGAEYLIALFADQALKDPSYLDEIEPGISTLLKWHAIEEIEHKAVAFDTYQAVGGYHAERVMVMVAISFIIWVYVTKCCLILLWKNKFLFNVKAMAIFLKFNFYKPGIFTKVIMKYFRFFRLNYHPWDNDNYHLIKKWKAKYPEIDKSY